MSQDTTRRDFIQTTTALGAAWWVSGGPKAFAKEPSPLERVRYACIGVGGKGRSDSADAGQHGDVVAICDIDENNLNKASKKFKKAEKFVDYREMLDTMGDKIDAVTVSTPDHSHAPASAMAMKMGKACFTQKPLTHSVYEARRLAEIAKESGVPTMMGNQGTAKSGLRKAAAIIKEGGLGTIKEVHIFTNRPVWKQGGERPPTEAVPKEVHWDLWLGPAPERPYAKGYHPFAWRGWWDFGTGALGDMACHTVNMPFMGLDLRNPTSIVAESSGHNRDSYPQQSKIVFQFPANEARPALPLIWYDGGYKPDVALLLGEDFKHDSGSIIVGENGTLYSYGDYGDNWMLLPTGEVSEPNVEFEESPGHFTEYHQAITGQRKEATSNFVNYAGPLTETILLGNLAVWADGKKIEWDSKNLKATNAPEVAGIIKNDYRDGYTL
ncbi:Glucose--fructose oxidoreductase precursor [Symmachiella macrocystis]|uniref:Glucose--fructose oxidoreductase n=1 Tax=Symmachiella macrocystis TaxID=2527985 RepID=A0A5C6BRL4_9PLAN|nr:Gfo/Idh/MocA family oxidoreductase [Symmachiella macrocystis]TWU13324.1 Glucose--fructose oxidoreductase precursor [Symmachiella macrocystis]